MSKGSAKALPLIRYIFSADTFCHPATDELILHMQPGRDKNDSLVLVHGAQALKISELVLGSGQVSAIGTSLHIPALIAHMQVIFTVVINIHFASATWAFHISFPPYKFISFSISKSFR
jgi:hypothetical protein